MAESHNLGIKGEELAAEHLKKSGYKILFRNWKWGKHEVDIIAGKDDIVVFVEVKTRTDEFLGGVASAISREKQNSIIYAAEGYIRRYNVDKESRFDVLTIIMSGETFTIDHIESAFYPTLR